MSLHEHRPYCTAVYVHWVCHKQVPCACLQRMPDWVTEVPGLDGKKQIPFIRVVKDDKVRG